MWVSVCVWEYPLHATCYNLLYWFRSHVFRHTQQSIQVDVLPFTDHPPDGNPSMSWWPLLFLLFIWKLLLYTFEINAKYFKFELIWFEFCFVFFSPSLKWWLRKQCRNKDTFKMFFKCYLCLVGKKEQKY